MRLARGSIATAGGVVLLVLTALAWIALAPTQAGGRATYVITSGTSMEPRFHSGDLALLRRASQYEVGEVVGYRDPQVGRVLHRIVGQEGGRFVMKGDSNSWLDPYQPGSSEVLGRLWLRVPKLGGWLAGLRQPRVATVLAVIGGGLLLAVPAAGEGRRRRRLGRGGPRASDPSPGRGPTGLLGVGGQLAAGALGVMAAVSVLLAAFAFSRPARHQTTAQLRYQHHGSFVYTAAARGGVYDGEGATTGQPVFRKLADKVSISFDYGLAGDALTGVRGDYRLDAVVSHEDGWTRTVVLAPETPFTGDRVTMTGVLDLQKVQALIDALQQQAGISSQTQRRYRVSVVPTVKLTGTLGGAVFQDTFAPALKFLLDPVELQLDRGGSEKADQLSPTTAGMVTQTRTVPGHLSLLAWQPQVVAARQVAVAGLVIAALGALVLAILTRRAERVEEPSRIRARYGPLLVTLRGSDLGTKGRLVEVASIEDLVKVAEREGRMVLHEQTGSTHDYFVQDVDVTYRYRTSGRETGAGQPATEAAS